MLGELVVFAPTHIRGEPPEPVANDVPTIGAQFLKIRGVALPHGIQRSYNREDRERKASGDPNSTSCTLLADFRFGDPRVPDLFVQSGWYFVRYQHDRLLTMSLDCAAQPPRLCGDQPHVHLPTFMHAIHLSARSSIRLRSLDSAHTHALHAQKTLTIYGQMARYGQRFSVTAL